MDRFYSKRIIKIDRPKINGEITAPELRVINEKGENLGVMPLKEALDLVKPESGIDLIEISPNAKPPVARLMSFDKYRYEKEKAEKKARQSQKISELKQIQISTRAAQNDRMVKIRQLEKFLNEGDQVIVKLVLKGREKYNKGWAFQKLDEFFKMVTVEYKVMREPRFDNRGLSVFIIKK